ncbi:hypothetical protein BPLS_P3421 [Bathymodiolus platifrons methanotrophic gill symbiont]|uniref:hypothetical protein n=1 Tax=Bathymodiolus platifrons methanotrophic gill symbiont TaxID=113268 RepID=UPI001B3D77D6|nr:hypothetical protein [Bathymodiolus platifrons methanotrophic gill symbiont]GFO75930.1 hypothetical protein BPLS_P3421 [Bathymodiolus platifrons methanotrophic gill symbiont]
MTVIKKKSVKKAVKKPPSKAIKSLQYDLFSQFLAKDESEVSNTVEYWERIPKYFLSAQEQNKLRTAEGLAQLYSYEYKVKDKHGNILPYSIDIQPALIKQSDGKGKAFFPTKAEEIIEEVLKKIFTEQSLGVHDPRKVESWVKFSYSMIRRELKNKGCERKYSQIKHSLEVMSKCVLTVYEDGKEIYIGSILQDYCSVDRAEYLADTEALHVARFPIFISHAVNTLQARQFNYARFLGCEEQLTRWIYKRLINRFVNANYMNTYHFLYSDMKQASGLLRLKDEKDNRKKVLSSLEELKEKGVILTYETEERKEGRKIAEVKYTLTAHSEFIAEQKAANKRENLQAVEARKQGLLVDKSNPR